MDRNDNGNAVAVSDLESLSARRAWIEIIFLLPLVLISLSLSARRAWIEINGVVSGSADYVESLSARRAWIEIRYAL